MKLNTKRISELMDLVYLDILDDKSCDEVIDIMREFVILNKALEMACDILGDMDDSNSNSEEWNEWLLQKAREQE